ncbi:MAG: HAMP domain-containing sensor histidine kinase [Saprospiraceae bacterium]|jgi:signal transduction histidine kinase|nr:HAMP domain-containing sensor histidine kinase [Saprospiraceae bacterium]
MDIYSRKSRWKLYLAIGGILIVFISMIYTNYLANQIAEEERKKVQHWLMAHEQLDKLPLDFDITLHGSLIQSNSTIPLILISETGLFIDAINFREDLLQDTSYLLSEVEKLNIKGFEPIENAGQLLYYKQSRLLTLIQYFPIFQLFLIGVLILFGYLAFSSARRSEQNRVWVGMAKETAHQLGTPISGIVAWIEHLKSIRAEDEEVTEILSELRNDVFRLELIADRFSKIGSVPKLEAINVFDELEKCRIYMQRRASRRVKFEFPNVEIERKDLNIMINPGLFDWVVENLLRNALDAMDGKGLIEAQIYEDKDYIYIDVSDTGSGIPPNKFKTVFQPGYSTKKRGWGLGLSLAKRIIEDYHSGKIFVKKSMVEEGTTFTIQLPRTVQQYVENRKD